MANEVSILVTAKDLATPTLQNVQGTAQSLSSTLTGMRGPLLAVTGGIGLMGGASIKAASGLNEQKAAMEVVFGASAGIVHAFAKDQADAYNISQRAAFQYTAQLGSIFKASGLAEDASAHLSVDMVKLAADLASFKDLSFDEALEKIRSGLVGETEPLRQVGVLLSAAEVDAQAVAMGFEKVNGQFSEGEKVAARVAIIQQQLADANGDVARTADSVANRARDVTQKSEDLAATWGETLLPITSQLLNLVSGVMTAFTALPEPVQNAIVVMGAIAAAIAAVGLVLPPIIAGVTALIALGPALGVAITVATGPFGLIALAIAAVIAAGILLWKNWDAVKEKAGELVDAIRGAFSRMRDGAAEFLRPVIEFIQGIVDKLRGVIDLANRLPGVNIGGGSGSGQGIFTPVADPTFGNPDAFGEGEGNGGRSISQSVSVGNVTVNLPAGVTHEEGEDMFVLALQRAGLEAVS